MLNKINPLLPAVLRPVCDPNQLKFTTTAEITNLVAELGQTRAQEALTFGIEMKQKGYHIFASGPSGQGKRYYIQQYLNHVAAQEPPPSDWCYVNNFKDLQKPIVLKFPPNGGEIFKEEMNGLISQLKFSIPAMFQSKEYQSVIQKIEEKFKDRETKILSKIQKEAKDNAIAIVGSPGNYEIAPMANNEIMTKEQIEKLSDAEKQDIKNRIEKLNKKLINIRNEMPEWFKDMYRQIKEVENDFCNTLVSSLMRNLKEKYTDLKILDYLRSVQEDIIQSSKYFMPQKDDVAKKYLNRYEVNLLIDNQNYEHAPVIFEPNPTYLNLVGQLEGSAENGRINSDFTSIKPGSLHKANGGYLIMEIKKVLKEIHTWDSLKANLLTEKITIEPLLIPGLVGVAQLKPEPIPLKIKVILLGDRNIYELLTIYDEDFNKIFKVLAEFEETMDRNDERIDQYAGYIARILKRKKLGAFHKEAIARVIDHCIRMTENSQKLTLHRQSIVQLLRESAHYARKEDRTIVTKLDVEKSIKAKVKRLDKIRDEYYELIEKNSILIEVSGEKIGQLNGLSVIALSTFSFGLPSRITAITRAGKDEVIDIQREVDLGGSIHSKGVLILSGFLKGHYAKEIPFYLSASLVFEQTYGLVDGDSASMGELCVLLSSLSNIPLKQSLAITGSVNQHGLAQAVGGINDKIEGFYDICKIRGLTGDQGVIIPQANIKNLMLRPDVVEACAKGEFHVYAVNNVNEALLLLTDRDPKQIHQQCESTLRQYADARRKYFDL